MKILKKICILLLVVCLGLPTAVACKKGPVLSAPSAVKVDNTTLVLSWNKVQNATNYLVSVNGKNSIVAKTTFNLVNLDAGKYTLKVKARDAKGGYADSEWSKSVTFEKEKENGLQYTLTNANTEYAVTGMGTASGNVVIADYYRGKPVTSIAQKAFYGKNGLTGIVVGNNVKTIGASAFTNCSKLKSVAFPDGVTEIGEYAFQACRNLTEIVLPASLTSVPKFAFRYCRYLKTVTFGGNETAIEESAFAECNKIESLTIPDSVTRIDKTAFRNCSALVSVDTGNGAVTVGESAFEECGALTAIKLGSSVKTIGDRAFAYCDALPTVTVPDSVETISYGAFYSCTALAEVKLGAGVKSIGQYAFTKTAAYDNGKDEGNGVYYVDKWAVDSNGDIKTFVLKNDTVGIADYAFYTRSSLENFTLPDSVVIIGRYAFAKAEKLTTFNLNKTEVIGDYAFSGCKTLGRGKVNLGTKLKTIGSYAFYNCVNYGDDSYAAVSIPDTVETIGTYAFNGAFDYVKAKTSGGAVYVDKWLVAYAPKEAAEALQIKEGTVGVANYALYNNSNVNQIYFPHSLKKIGMAAFYGCSALTTVRDQLSQITEISDYAFYKCANLSNVEISNKVKRIGRSAFYKSGVMSVEISKNVEEIGPYAYYGCEDLLLLSFAANSALKKIGEYAFGNDASLKRVELPDGLSQIGKRAFYKCSALGNVTFGDGMETLGEGVFEQCVALTKISLPASLKEIGKRAFYKCAAIAEIDFANVEKVGNYAFYGCSALTGLNIPATLKEIGDYAFRNCGLKTVILPSTLLSVGAHAFNGNPKTTFFLESETVPEGWSARWNSAYRPVYTGCTLSEDKTYVVSFVKTENSLINVTEKTAAGDPERAGYTFGGWKLVAENSEEDVIYKSSELAAVADGSRLEAIWNENTQVG